MEVVYEQEKRRKCDAETDERYLVGRYRCMAEYAGNGSRNSSIDVLGNESVVDAFHVTHTEGR